MKCASFNLKISRWDKNSIKVIIIKSSVQVAKDIAEDILRKCYYQNQDDFKSQWQEKWYQKWDGMAWVIKFRLNGNVYV
jgi:hypothetical protein